jgi:hypothetical protein
LLIDPTTYKNWDELLLSTPGASFFHSTAWAKVLTESYKYQPVYFVAINSDKLDTLCAMMDVRSSITGRRGVSLPFTDYCEPIATGSTNFREMLNSVIAFGKKQNWKYLEFRGGEQFLKIEEPAEYFYGHRLDLSLGPQEIFSSLRSSTRRNIKKAEKEDISVSISTSHDTLQEFCRLNTLTRRDHGLPPQPYHFFRSLHNHVLSKNLGFIILAYSNDTAIAGNAYFHFGNQVIYKYGASDKQYQHLRANNLIMWEAIKWSCDRGYKSFCFGRTEPDNEGLRQFKKGWGAKEYLIKYYKYDIQKDAFVKKSRTINPIYNNIFGKLPPLLLNTLGALLYRHMG